jgi:cation:H+ antiporter
MYLPAGDGRWTLIAGSAMLYVGGRSAALALSGDAPSPGRRAIGHWLPIASIAIVAVLLGQRELALGIIFATSIASLALVGGCVCIMGTTPDEPAVWPEAVRPPCALLLPVAVLAFLAGFSGQLGWFNCVILAIEGLLVWSVWSKPLSPSPGNPGEGGGGGGTPSGATNPHPDPPPDYQGRGKEGPQNTSGTRSPVKTGCLLLAAALCPIGALAAVKGAIRMSVNPDFPPSLVAAATIVSPILVASLLLNGSSLVQRGHAWAAHATHAGVVQLNLCALLPLTAILWRLRWGESLVYPISNWRIDAVVLILLAAALLPAAAGKWRPQRFEGGFYLFLYIAYVLAVVAVSF